MRRIGAELGTDPTAVYRYFPSKAALLSSLCIRLFSTEPRLDPDRPWQDRLRCVIRHAYERYRAHPDLGILLARQRDDLPPLVRIRELMLDLLVNGAGMELESAALMSHVIENHVVGCGLFFAISEYERDPEDSLRRALRRAYAMLTDSPLASRAAPHLFPDPDVAFDATTELLISAIERQDWPVPSSAEVTT